MMVMPRNNDIFLCVNVYKEIIYICMYSVSSVGRAPDF